MVGLPYLFDFLPVSGLMSDVREYRIINQIFQRVAYGAGSGIWLDEMERDEKFA